MGRTVHSYASTADDAPTLIVGSPTDAEIIFTGPPGVGKTTAVRTLSDYEPINTEVPISGMSDTFDVPKHTTTVGIDFGIYTHPEPHQTIGLFGTAGQARFTETHHAFNNPEATIVLMVYGHSTHQDINNWFDTILIEQRQHRTVIVRNTIDGRLTANLEDCYKQRNVTCTIHDLDPRNKDDLINLTISSISRTKASLS